MSLTAREFWTVVHGMILGSFFLLAFAGGLAVVMVEQKASHALSISDRGYVMHLGQVAIEGRAQELLGNDDVKRLFLGEIPESMKALSLSDA